MTSEELRALDAEVHRKVFGGELRLPPGWHAPGTVAMCVKAPVPPYSTDIRYAWKVAEWLREQCGQFDLVAGHQWHCGHSSLPGGEWGSGKTASLAICKAALAYVRHKEGA